MSITLQASQVSALNLAVINNQTVGSSTALKWPLSSTIGASEAFIPHPNFFKNYSTLKPRNHRLQAFKVSKTTWISPFKAISLK